MGRWGDGRWEMGDGCELSPWLLSPPLLMTCGYTWNIRKVGSLSTARYLIPPSRPPSHYTVTAQRCDYEYWILDTGHWQTGICPALELSQSVPGTALHRSPLVESLSQAIFSPYPWYATGVCCHTTMRPSRPCRPRLFVFSSLRVFLSASRRRLLLAFCYNCLSACLPCLPACLPRDQEPGTRNQDVASTVVSPCSSVPRERQASATRVGRTESSRQDEVGVVDAPTRASRIAVVLPYGVQAYLATMYT
ncbi:hypothetical protein F4780DRAFT_723873 [Xylariomycetidae sp. FL0641]|nr:hypothetical protein F4780DRAFT_723873 [Xylariomycetidae sp. FL0641]